MKPASFFDVIMAIKNQTPMRMHQTTNLVTLKSIALESGNGRTWNVGIERSGGKQETVFYNEDATTPKFFIP